MKTFEELLFDIENNSITEIKYSYSSVGVEGAKALAKVLEANNSVTYIDLSGNDIGEEGAIALATSLKGNDTLISVELCGNNIGVAGAKALAEVLKYNNSVTAIDLSSNNIGFEGAMDLAESLEVNNSLTSIDLSINNTGDAGIRALAKALKVNNSVTNVKIHCNGIVDLGARALIEVLKHNSTITMLTFANTFTGGYRVEGEYIAPVRKEVSLNKKQLDKVIEFITTFEQSSKVDDTELNNIHLVFRYGKRLLEEQLKTYLDKNNVEYKGCTRLEAQDFLYTTKLCNMDLKVNFFASNLICKDITNSDSGFKKLLITDIINKILIDDWVYVAESENDPLYLGNIEHIGDI